MELKEKVMLVGAAKAIGESNSCTTAVARLYKSYKRYWNKQCESLYRELAVQEDIAIPTTRAALHIVILAEFKTELRQTIARDILQIFFSKQITQGNSGDFGSDPDYVGSVLLIYHYYLYITQTQTAEDIEHMELFPKVYASCSIENMVAHWLEDKISDPLFKEVPPSERYITLVKYVYDYVGIKLDISTSPPIKFFEDVARFLADTQAERKNYLTLCHIVYQLALLTSQYRESYLKLAIKPEIGPVSFGKARSSAADLAEIGDLKKKVQILEERLENSDKLHRRVLSDLDKEHKAEVSRLNKDIKLLKEGKKIKH